MVIMKKHVKILSMVLAVLLLSSVFTAMPLSAGAATTAGAVSENSGTTGDCTWSFDESTGTLTISGRGAMGDYNDIGDLPWYGYPIKKAVLENGVKNIGECAFGACSKMTEISIPGTVRKIGDNAFHRCLGLTGITIPTGVTVIGLGAFYTCENLKSVKLPYSIYSIGRAAFRDCQSLESIEIPQNTVSLGTAAFWGCSSLKSAVVGNNISVINQMTFSDCSNLENVVLGNKLKEIDNFAFMSCNSLKSISIPAKVERIGKNAFYECAALTDVYLQSKVETIDEEAFVGCVGLKNATILNKDAAIGEHALGYDSRYDKDNNVFIYDKVNGFTVWGLEGSTAETYAKANGFPVNKINYQPEKSGMTGDCEWSFDESTGTLTISGSGAMADYLKPWMNLDVKNIVIENGVTVIGKNTFEDCSYLETVTIADSVTSIGDNAFAGCESMTEAVIPDSVKEIGNGAFSGCVNLSSLELGNGLTSVGLGAFTDCNNLKGVTIPESVTSIGNIAFGFYNDRENFEAKQIEGFSIYGKKGTAAENYANTFRLDFYESGSQNVGITGDCTWSFDAGTGVLTISGNGKMEDYNEWGGAPWHGLKIKSTVIENGVKNIGTLAFVDCKSMESISVPDSVANIGKYALGYCYDNSRMLVKVDGFTICGVKGSAAETYANENGFTFNEIVVPAEKTDEQTGVSAVLTDDLSLKVDDVTADDTIKNIVVKSDEKIVKAFDITLLKNGSEAQPSGSVTVKIPCDNENAKVYRVESDNSLTDMKAVYSAGCMEFTTDHFSVYLLTSQAEKKFFVGDINSDGKVNGSDAAVLSRYTSGWAGYDKKIKNMDAADINRDGKVNGQDAAFLARYSSGWRNYNKFFIEITA